MLKKFNKIKQDIEQIWKLKEKSFKDKIFLKKCQNLLEEILSYIEEGEITICYEDEKKNWLVNEWIKKAIVLFFRLNSMIKFTTGESFFCDKIHQLVNNEQKLNKIISKNTRLVPGCNIRKGVFIGKKVIIMPSFINIGANIGDNSMIDSGVTIGSCAHVGENCHISSNVVLGGVLEPICKKPVIISNNCFISAGVTITEGVVISRNSVVGSGCNITSTTKVIDLRNNNRITYSGMVPENSVVVPGVVKKENYDNVFLNCVFIIKEVCHSTLSKTSINDTLRK